MSEVKTNSPGYNRTRIDGDTSLYEMPWCGKLNIRGNPNDAEFVKKSESIFGLSLPMDPNTCANGTENLIYWLGPNEWLLHCEISKIDTLQNDLKEALSKTHNAVVDVSDYYTILKLEGSDSAKLLARACSLDLHPNVFVNGACTQTRFGHASILLHKTSKAPGFKIQIRWSYTEYVWDYLVSAMQSLN